VAEDPILLDSAVVTENRESWIEAWTETVLR
jgi:ABC-type thiamine transport system substrate-binding protein